MIFFKMVVLTFILVFSGSSFTWAAATVSQLKGDYAFTVHSSYATDGSGFDSNLAHLSGGTSANGIATGIDHFNGDGTGSAEIDFLGINHTSNGAGQQPVEQNHVSCSFTYTVNADQSFNVNATCTGSIIAGAFAGQTISGQTITFNGRITQNGAMLLITDTVPDVESRTRTDGINTITAYTIVGRSGVAIKIK
jgi:hypothetical protein